MPFALHVIPTQMPLQVHPVILLISIMNHLAVNLFPNLHYVYTISRESRVHTLMLVFVYYSAELLVPDKHALPGTSAGAQHPRQPCIVHGLHQQLGDGPDRW